VTRRRTKPRPTTTRRAPAKRASKPTRTRAKPPTPTGAVATTLAQVREFCLALPEVSEKSSHGHPTFLYKKRVLAYFLDNHHNDGRLALWLPAPDGVQAMLVDSNPDHYFVPPYGGHSGWVGVRLDRSAPWSEVSSMIESAHQLLAAKKR
jgi:hypothetical protein